MAKALTIIKTSIFGVIALAIVGVVDLCSAFYVAALFNPDSEALLGWTISISIFLSLLFIFTIVLDARFNNIFLRISHLLTSLWKGFFIYLFFASVLYSLVEIRSVGFALLALAVAFSTYGLVHARKIKVRRIEVAMPGLPASWKNRKAVFVSDIHLGHILREGFAAKVAEKIRSLSPDIIFIGGDLYDGSKVDERAVIRPFATLKPSLGTYFVTGNHEEFSNNPHFIHAIREGGITVLENDIKEVDGLQIVGVNDKDSDENKKFAATLSGISIDRSKPSVLLKHQPIGLDLAEQAGISLQLSGHTHSAQQAPLNLLTRMIYKKYHHGQNMFGSMATYTSSGVGTWGPPIRVGTDSEVVLISFIC